MLVAGTAGSDAQQSDTAVLPVSDPRYATMVVARVGPATITARQFLLSYEFGPAFVKRGPDSRRKHLDFMINEALLGLDAARRGAGATPRVRRSVAEIEGDLATEELYRDDILSKVRVSQAELEAAMKAQRVHFRLRWLYAPTRETIDSIRGALARGATFDSLYRGQAGDSSGTALRSWTTTPFQVRNERPELAALADTLQPAAPSAPVEGPDGWYIICKDGVTFDAIVTDAEAMKGRYDAERAITQRKADTLATDYVNRMMSSHEPVIDPEAFGLLSVSLAQTWVPKDRLATWNLGGSLNSEMRLAATTNIDRFGGRTLVRMADRTVSLGRFLSWFRARDTVLKLRTTSSYAFETSLEQLIWRMVRDGLLIERATHRGLQNRENVRSQKQWWEQKVLYTVEKNALLDSISVGDSAMHAYYRGHVRDYMTPAGDTLSFDRVRDRVQSDYREAQLRARMLHRLIALRRTYPVTVDENLLRRLPVDAENDPRTVDVYVAKTGGTFPHPAFPTIDFDWEGWQ